MKRLVLCLDGTWNTPRSETNVTKIQLSILAEDQTGIPQVTYYDQGVGTGDWIDRIKGGIFGAGLDRNVEDAYRFLVNNYVEDDEIYIFGFSRGAFTARRLAGFLGWAKGCLKKRDLPKLPEIYLRYKMFGDREGPGDAFNGGQPINEITCVGVWDTVGALGIPTSLWRAWNKKNYQFRDRELGTLVRNGFHALAVDERRGPFEPTLWEVKKCAALPDGQTVEQVWFAGVHGSVGGGMKLTGLSNLALHWMVDRVRNKTDLAFDHAYLKSQKGHPDGAFLDNRRWLYWLYAPLVRTLTGAEFKKPRYLLAIPTNTNRPSRGNRFVNEDIHKSAVDRVAAVPRYGPRNLLAALSRLVAD